MLITIVLLWNGNQNGLTSEYHVSVNFNSKTERNKIHFLSGFVYDLFNFKFDFPYHIMQFCIVFIWDIGVFCDFNWRGIANCFGSYFNDSFNFSINIFRQGAYHNICYFNTIGNIDFNGNFTTHIKIHKR